jgi:hypothetical protein
MCSVRQLLVCIWRFPESEFSTLRALVMHLASDIVMSVCAYARVI